MLRSTNEGVVNFATGMYNTFNAQGSNPWIYWLLYFIFVVVLTFFYTDVMFTQQNYGDNLKKMGAQIPGVNRGAPTQKYLTKVQRRITLPGALFLGLVAVLPFLIGLALNLVGINTGILIHSIPDYLVRLTHRGWCSPGYLHEH